MNLIPKKIHFIWFGTKENFIYDDNRMKKFAPEYDIKIWKEEDFNWDELNKIPFVKKAYEEQRWSFLSDYIRLKILYEEGGIYLDHDMKILKNLDHLINKNKELILCFENTVTLSMGFAASVPKNKFFKELKEIYENYEKGNFIIGNIIWDYVAKKQFNFKLNGKYKENNKYIVYDYEKFSLIKESKKTKILNNQYFIHNHQVTWVPKNLRKPIRLVIFLSQKITFINKGYWIFYFWPKLQLKKNYINKMYKN
ncbi:MAG: glycosyl transferase [Candidatus Tyloplasma litorale]|nr:MAG: glycosyl transferase [Mycoplasmatales bacterium]